MKKLFVLPFILILLVSCQDKQALAELENLKAQIAIEEQNIALVKKYVELWNNHELENISEFVDPELKLFLPSNTANPMTPDQFKGWYEMIYEGYPDINYEIKEIFADGDKVSVRWVCTGTHSGDNMGIPATGKKIVGSAVEIYLIKDGKIVEERAETDAIGWNQQLGYTLVLEEK